LRCGGSYGFVSDRKTAGEIVSIYYRWDADSRKYIECTEDEWRAEGQGGPVYTPSKKKLLEDVDTRFNHLGDLIEWLNEGIEAVQNSLSRYNNKNDEVRLAGLQNTLTFVYTYRDVLANVDAEKWGLNQMLDQCAPDKSILEQIRRERIQKQDHEDAKGRS
jgi:hypothetical protein